MWNVKKEKKGVEHEMSVETIVHGINNRSLESTQILISS